MVAPVTLAARVAVVLTLAALSACGIDGTPSGTSVATIGESVPPSEGFTAVTEPRTGHLDDGTSWTVMLPQVRGGDPHVRTAFNNEADAILTRLTGQPSGNGQTIGDGSIGTAERSRTIVGDRTLSGVVIVLGNAKGAAYPSLRVATVVLDNQTGTVIDDPFTDRSEATKLLASRAAAHDPTGRLRDGATYSSFTAWVPLPEGFHMYVEVPHVLGDYVQVTLPWNEVTGLLKPDAAQLLVG